MTPHKQREPNSVGHKAFFHICTEDTHKNKIAPSWSLTYSSVTHPAFYSKEMIEQIQMSFFPYLFQKGWEHHEKTLHTLCTICLSSSCQAGASGQSTHTRTHTNAHRIKTAWKTDISLSYMLFKGLCNIWWNTSFKTSLFVIFNTHVENVK